MDVSAALTKFAKQDNTKPQRSATGDDHGISVADGGPWQRSGHEAWDISRYAKSNAGHAKRHDPYKMKYAEVPGPLEAVHLASIPGLEALLATSRRNIAKGHGMRIGAAGKIIKTPLQLALRNAAHQATSPSARIGSVVAGMIPFVGDLASAGVEATSVLKGGPQALVKARKAYQESGIEDYVDKDEEPSEKLENMTPFEVTQAAHVHAKDRVIAANRMMRDKRPLHYWLNPLAGVGPAMELGLRADRRLNAYQGTTPSKLRALASHIPVLGSLPAILAGGGDRAQRLRDAFAREDVMAKRSAEDPFRMKYAARLGRRAGSRRTERRARRSAVPAIPSRPNLPQISKLPGTPLERAQEWSRLKAKQRSYDAQHGTSAPAVKMPQSSAGQLPAGPMPDKRTDPMGYFKWHQAATPEQRGASRRTHQYQNVLANTQSAAGDQSINMGSAQLPQMRQNLEQARTRAGIGEEQYGQDLASVNQFGRQHQQDVSNMATRNRDPQGYAMRNRRQEALQTAGQSLTPADRQQLASGARIRQQAGQFRMGQGQRRSQQVHRRALASQPYGGYRSRQLAQTKKMEQDMFGQPAGPKPMTGLAKTPQMPGPLKTSEAKPEPLMGLKSKPVVTDKPANPKDLVKRLVRSRSAQRFAETIGSGKPPKTSFRG